MNKEQAAALLRSLAERARINAATGAITVEISLSEKRALEHAASWLAGDDPVTPLPAPAPFPLNLMSTTIQAPENPEILLCLDFGTAMSKAFARRLTDDELLPLAIGQRANVQAEPVFGLISSVYVSPDGRLLFGQDAVSASQDGRAADLRRIDSFKDMLAKGDAGREIGQALLDAKSNPTGIMLQEIDVLTLYLAYLTDMAVTELVEKYGLSRYVRRRFTLPVFDHERSTWAKRQLRDVLAQAQVLADTFNGRWKAGIPAAEAKDAVTAVRQAKVAPVLVEEGGVTEPIAAIASRVHGVARSGGAKQIFAVVDVGAGTIDFALFYRVPQEDKPDRFFLIPGTEKFLRQAGNQVDNVLAAFILQRAGVRPSDQDFARIESALALDVRRLKEALFRGDGTLLYELVNDREVQITREEFLQSEGIRNLEQQIHRKFEDMINSADESWFIGTALGEVVTLVTGGGADLPFVRSLGGKQMTRGRPLSIQLGTPRPRYIETEYPALSDEYPRLAVALGGSSGHLPELASRQFAALGASRIAHHLETVSKGI